jgi:hypothetical protein
MLLLVVSAAGVVLYAYSLGAFNASSSSLRLLTGLKEEKARERFAIVAIWWNAGTQMNLTLVNYGQIEFAIDAAYMNGTAVTSFSSGKGANVGAWELVRIKFTSPIPILSGRRYEIAAVSLRGSTSVVYWKT